MTVITTAGHLGAQSMPSVQKKLKKELRTAKMRKTATALLLIAPLAIFLLMTFVAPIALLLKRAIDNQEISSTLPHTISALAGWDHQSLPSDQAYEALALDLAIAQEKSNIGGLARRMNIELPGARSVVMKTSRSISLFSREMKPFSALELKNELVKIDAHWGQLEYWNLISRNSAPYSPYYLLASLDLRLDAAGDIVQADDGASIYRTIFSRTLWMSTVVTICTRPPATGR